MTSKISRSPSIRARKYAFIYIVMWFRLFVGVYSKLYDNIIFSVIARIYCIGCVFIALHKHLQLWDFLVKRNYILLAAQKLTVYITIVVVSMASDGEHFNICLNELENIDPLTLLHLDNNLIISRFIFVLIVSLGIYRIWFLMFFRSFFTLHDVYIESIVLMGIYSSHMSRILMFDMIWSRLRCLSLTMESNILFYGNVKNYIEIKKMKIEQYLLIYKRILVTMNNIGTATKILILVSLPHLLVTIFTIVLDNVKYSNHKTDSLYIFDAIMSITLPCFPALLVELANIEVDKIKFTLTTELKQFTSESLQSKIVDALKYLEVRPPKYTVWRTIDVDISLPISIISIATTYTIVLVQYLTA